MQLDGFVPQPALPSLATCIDSLVIRGIPPIFALVYDEFWALFRDIAIVLSRDLGADFHVLADSWAWHVPAQPGKRGWPMHRDYRNRVVRREDGLATRLNAWVALTDTPLDHACLSVLPLPRDPHYPTDLHTVEGIDSMGRALPVDGGAVLVWDANILHWGGPANPAAPSPRISIAVTVELPEYGGWLVDLKRGFAFHDRLDVIAFQIMQYKWREPTLPPELCQWARMLMGLRELRARQQLRPA